MTRDSGQCVTRHEFVENRGIRDTACHWGSASVVVNEIVSIREHNVLFSRNRVG